MRNKLFNVRELEDEFKAQITNGWFVDYLQGKLYYGRVGDVTGGGGAILIIPEENLVITGAVNLTTKIEEPPVFSMAIPFLPPTEDEIKKESVPVTDEKN